MMNDSALRVVAVVYLPPTRTIVGLTFHDTRHWIASDWGLRGLLQMKLWIGHFAILYASFRGRTGGNGTARVGPARLQAFGMHIDTNGAVSPTSSNSIKGRRVLRRKDGLRSGVQYIVVALRSTVTNAPCKRFDQLATPAVSQATSLNRIVLPCEPYMLLRSAASSFLPLALVSCSSCIESRSCFPASNIALPSSYCSGMHCTIIA